MTHKTGFLSGDEPQEIEEKTEAQKIDERRPAAMATSKSMYDFAENGDTPAIEQRIDTQNIIGEKNEASQPKFEIDSKFAQEMKEREAKERAERAEREKERKEQDEKTRKKRQNEIEEKLKQPQTLDEEESRRELTEETARNNLGKLYPDAKPLHSDVEDELWRRRTDNGRKASERAKIESTYDTNLSKAISVSLLMQIPGIVIIASAFFGQPKGIILPILYIVGIAAIIASTIILIGQANKCKNRTIPSDQHAKFTLATTIPGFILRLLFITLFSSIPLTGSLIGYIAGSAIGASIHYQVINRYNVSVSITNTVLNTTVFIVMMSFILLPSIIAPNLFNLGVSIMSTIAIIINIVMFFLGDYVAMRLALYTNK